MAGNPNGHVMFGCDLVGCPLLVVLACCTDTLQQTVQALVEGRQIPVVVTKCIEAVEAFGTLCRSIFTYCTDSWSEQA